MTDTPYTRRFLGVLKEQPQIEATYRSMLAEAFEEYNNQLIAAADWPSARFAQGAMAAIQHLLDLPEKESRDGRARRDYDERTNRPTA